MEMIMPRDLQGCVEIVRIGPYSYIAFYTAWESRNNETQLRIQS